jgi:stage II sporulation protein D
MRRLALFALLPALATAAEVRVRLYWTLPPARLVLRLADGTRREVTTARPGAVMGARALVTPEGELPLPGRLAISTSGGKISAVLHLPLERYVVQVLAGEASTFTSPEALKAMAVAVRSYARAYPGRHAAEGFDYCDTTHCQDFRLVAPAARLEEAAAAVEGESLWFEGRPAAAYYHRHCGGMTEAAGVLWPGAGRPYLHVQRDEACLRQGDAAWQATLPLDALARALGVAYLPGLAVETHTASGRAATLLAGGLVIDAERLHLAVGRALGWNLLRSRRYEVSLSPGVAHFRGTGAGHGAGLCQTGAEQRGRAGAGYREILAFYYPGTRAGLNAQGISWRRLGGERAEVWLTTVRAPEADLVRLADRAIAMAERLSGLAIPGRPRFRFYPDLETFRDHTGEPGWVAASTRGDTVRIQPPEKLIAGGALERVLVHEALHLTVEAAATPGLPAWFPEGLVLYLEGAPVASAGGYGKSHAEAHARVTRLAAHHGRAALLGWLREGLPTALR